MLASKQTLFLILIDEDVSGSAVSRLLFMTTNIKSCKFVGTPSCSVANPRGINIPDFSWDDETGNPATSIQIWGNSSIRCNSVSFSNIADEFQVFITNSESSSAKWETVPIGNFPFSVVTKSLAILCLITEKYLCSRSVFTAILSRTGTTTTSSKDDSKSWKARDKATRDCLWWEEMSIPFSFALIPVIPVASLNTVVKSRRNEVPPSPDTQQWQMIFSTIVRPTRLSKFSDFKITAPLLVMSIFPEDELSMTSSPFGPNVAFKIPSKVSQIFNASTTAILNLRRRSWSSSDQRSCKV